jgi:hypothetical protein
MSLVDTDTSIIVSIKESIVHIILHDIPSLAVLILLIKITRYVEWAQHHSSNLNRA